MTDICKEIMELAASPSFLLTALSLSVLSLCTCVLCWWLFRRASFLMWQGLALMIGTAVLWLLPMAQTGGSSMLVPMSVIATGFVLMALAMAQGSAVRLGQPHATSRLLAAMAVAVTLLSLTLGMAQDSMTAWACAGALGQTLWVLWHTPMRHRLDRTMLLAYTACTLWLLLYPLFKWWLLPFMGMPQAMHTWAWGMLTLVIGYSVALMACAWADSSYRGLNTYQDPLTGLLPKRGLEAACHPSPYERGLRMLMLCEVDKWQQIQAQHGQPMADEVLRDLGRILESSVREGDHVGRVGRDVFVIVLRDMAPGDASALPHRIRQQLAGAPWAQQMSGAAVSVSFGSTQIQERDSFDMALHRAEVMLYQAQDAEADRSWKRHLANAPLRSASFSS